MSAGPDAPAPTRWSISEVSVGPIRWDMTLDEVTALLDDTPWVAPSYFGDRSRQALYSRWGVKVVLGADESISQILVFKEGPVVPTYQGARLFGSLKRVGPAVEAVGADMAAFEVPGFAVIKGTSTTLALTESGKSVVGVCVGRAT